MNNKISTYRNFNEILKEKLQSPTFAIGYLNEALADGDERVFLLALRHVIEARGNISGLKEHEEDPKLSNILDIFKAMGVQLELKWA